MSDEQLTPDPPLPPACHLDAGELASIVMRLPMISAQLGHANVKGTARDYLAPHDLSPEAEFACDLFILSTEEMCEKWYGGSLVAIHALTANRSWSGGQLDEPQGRPRRRAAGPTPDRSSP